MFNKVKNWLNPGPSESKSGHIDKTDLKKVAITGVLTAVAAGIAYFVSNVEVESLGKYGPAITAGLTILLDLLRRMLKDNAQDN